MAYSACIYTVKTTRGPDRPCCSSGQAGHKQIMKLNKPKEKCGRRSISCKFIIIPKLHALAISVSIIAMYQQKGFWCTNIAFATVGVGMSICLSHSWTVSKPPAKPIIMEPMPDYSPAHFKIHIHPLYTTQVLPWLAATILFITISIPSLSTTD